MDLITRHFLILKAHRGHTLLVPVKLKDTNSKVSRVSTIQSSKITGFINFLIIFIIIKQSTCSAQKSHVTAQVENRHYSAADDICVLHPDVSIEPAQHAYEVYHCTIATYAWQTCLFT